MSARQVRRSFATPFIVTLAGSSLAVGCGRQPAPNNNYQPGPNPPSPPEAFKQPPPETTPPTTAETPPEAPPSTPEPAKEPAREPAKYDQRWTVMRFKGKAECSAMVDVQCPKPEPGKVVPTCNPPPPMPYTCPDGFKEGDTMKIVLRAGATECFVDYEPIKCPKGALCNPPPPRKVACPAR